MPPSLVIHRTDLRAHRLVFLPFATSGGSRVTVVAISRAARERLRAALHRYRVAKVATGEAAIAQARAGARGVLTRRSSPAERGNVVGLHA